MGEEESQWLSFLSEEERARIGKMCGSSCATCDDDRQAYRTVAALRALVAEQKKGLLAATDALDGVVKWNEEVDGFALPDGVSDSAYLGLDKGNDALALTEAEMRKRLEEK